MRRNAFLLTPLFLAVANAYSFDEFDDTVDQYVFVTPANMASFYGNSPNSVTSLDFSLLEALGIRSMTDAMRLVPGMVVAESHGSSSTIGYHGTSVHVPRRTQVLFNSNRIYRSGYSDMLWERTPFDLSDLAKIEVVRGASAADWGSNAFSSTVNMIQRPVALRPDLTVQAEGGEGGYRKYLAASAFDIGSSKHGIRASKVEDDGFDFSHEIDEFTDSYEGESLLYNGEYEFAPGKLLDWYVAGSQFEYLFPSYNNLTSEDVDQQATVGTFSASAPTQEDTISGNIKFSATSISNGVQSEVTVGANIARFSRDQAMTYCFPGFFYDPILEQLDAADNIHLEFADVELLFGSSLMYGVGVLNESIKAPLSEEQQGLLYQFGQSVQQIGLDPFVEELCSSASQDVVESRYSLFGEYTRIGKKLTYSINLYVSESIAESETYLNGEHSRSSVEWSHNLRYSLTEDTTINAGFLADYDSDIDDVFYSPRVSLNHLLTPNNAVRLTASRSRRLPGIHETERDWQYDVEFDVEGPDYLGRESGRVLRRTVSGDLEPEINDTVELGYTYWSNVRDAVLDIKIFREEYSQLISEPFSFIGFNLTNNGEATVEGVETEFSRQFEWGVPVLVGGVFTYLDNQTSTLEEKTLYSRTFGSLYSVVTLDAWKVGMAYYGSENQAFNAYDRFDLNIMYETELGESDLEVALNYRHYPTDQANLSEYSSIDPYRFGYLDQDRVVLRLQVSF